MAAHILSVGEVTDRPFDPMGEQGEILDRVRRAPFPVLEQKAGEKMRKTILEAREQRDSVGGVVECESIKVAGASFDEAIVKYVRHKHNMLIGLGTAEELKRSIGCVIQRPDVGMEEIKGRSLTNGLPKTVTISSNELIEAFVEPMNHILESIHTVLERTPPQLVGDLDSNGIIMSGGGSLIYGIDRLIERSTGIRTMVVDDPISCAAYGAGKMLSHLNDMQDGMMNFYRKRQLKG